VNYLIFVRYNECPVAGQVHVPLAAIDLAADDLEFWREIREPPKNVLGDVCISLRYAPQKRPPQLNVIVIECKNLKQMDLGGASDPYVKINHMVNGKRIKKYKTTVKMADLNPYYNQSFKIEVRLRACYADQRGRWPIVGNRCSWMNPTLSPTCRAQCKHTEVERRHGLSRLIRPKSFVRLKLRSDDSHLT
jgi:hypothetical protein